MEAFTNGNKLKKLRVSYVLQKKSIACCQNLYSFYVRQNPVQQMYGGAFSALIMVALGVFICAKRK